MLQGLLRRTRGDRAVDANGEPARPERPSIGIALGGGCARGFAHIGVLRTLAANGIKPDIIAGTSMGAVVGGCYAAGQIDSIEQWALRLTRRHVLRYLDVSLAGSGLISGNRLAHHLETALGRTKIESLLPTRFAAIATGGCATGRPNTSSRGRSGAAICSGGEGGGARGSSRF